MKSMNYKVSTALIAAMVLLLTACGGSRPKGELPPPADPPAPAPMVKPAPPPPPPTAPAPEPPSFNLEGVRGRSQACRYNTKILRDDHTAERLSCELNHPARNQGSRARL